MSGSTLDHSGDWDPRSTRHSADRTTVRFRAITLPAEAASVDVSKLSADQLSTLRKLLLSAERGLQVSVVVDTALTRLDHLSSLRRRLLVPHDIESQRRVIDGISREMAHLESLIYTVTENSLGDV